MLKITQDTRKLTVTGGSTYYITIPQAMIKELGWKKGEKKNINLEQGRVVIEDWKE